MPWRGLSRPPAEPVVKPYGCDFKTDDRKATVKDLFFIFDDTMVSKFGKIFENISKLFIHAVHNSSNYLNRYGFVSIILCVPVWNKNRIPYLPIRLDTICGRKGITL